jgi:hypothetical protein
MYVHRFLAVQMLIVRGSCKIHIEKRNFMNLYQLCH